MFSWQTIVKCRRWFSEWRLTVYQKANRSKLHNADRISDSDNCTKAREPAWQRQLYKAWEPVHQTSTTADANSDAAYYRSATAVSRRRSKAGTGLNFLFIVEVPPLSKCRTGRPAPGGTCWGAALRR